jgi:hypothetical protein
MNGELWAPGKPIYTKPYCGKRGSAATDPIIPSYSWHSDEETEQSPKPKNTNENSYSGRPGMETSGVLDNCVLLRLRKVTATRQLKVDHSLTVKATKPKTRRNIQRYNKERLGQKRK